MDLQQEIDNLLATEKEKPPYKPPYPPLLNMNMGELYDPHGDDFVTLTLQDLLEAVQLMPDSDFIAKFTELNYHHQLIIFRYAFTYHINFYLDHTGTIDYTNAGQYVSFPNFMKALGLPENDQKVILDVYPCFSL